MTWPRYETNIIDDFTLSLESLALEIAKSAKENNKMYFIGGGFSIEFSVGKITRNHHDIDFHPMVEDIDWWREWFKQKGYKVRRRIDREFPETFKIKDRDGNPVVDMWPFKFYEDVLLIKHKGQYADSGRYWDETKEVLYKGVQIRIENPERVLEQKLRHFKKGQEFRKQDIHDFEMLGKKPDLG